MEKGKRKNKSQHFCFQSNNKLGAEKSVMKIFIGKKNGGMNKRPMGHNAHLSLLL